MKFILSTRWKILPKLPQYGKGVMHMWIYQVHCHWMKSCCPPSNHCEIFNKNLKPNTCTSFVINGNKENRSGLRVYMHV